MPDHTRRKLPAKSSLSLLFFRHASRFVIRFLHRNFVEAHEWASPSIEYAERGSAPPPPLGTLSPSSACAVSAPSQTHHRRHPPHHDHRRIGVAVVFRTPFSTPSWGSAFPGAQKFCRHPRMGVAVHGVCRAGLGAPPPPPPGTLSPSSACAGSAPSQTHHRRHPPHHDHRRMRVAVFFPSFSGRRFPRRAGAQRSQEGGPQAQGHAIPEKTHLYSYLQ